jgi:hypothetical protein
MAICPNLTILNIFRVLVRSTAKFADQKILVLIATAQAIDPRADSGNIESVSEIGSERRHAVAVTALHALNDQ